MRRRLPIILAVIVLVLVCVRLALPSIIHWGINRALAKNEQVTGSVGDVSLALWRGAYKLEDLKLRDAQRRDMPPFADIQTADLSIDMREAIHGSILAKVKLEKPAINVAAIPKKKHAEEAKEGATEVRKTVVPFQLSHIEVSSGTIMVPTEAAGGPEAKIEKVFLVGENLFGTGARKEGTKALLKARGVLPGNGAMTLNLNFVPGSDPVKFDLDFKMEGLDLPALNPLIKKSIGMDVSQGTGNLYSEIRSEGGHFEGYVKPMFQHLKITGKGDQKDTFKERIKEDVAEVAKNVFKNDKKDSVATRIPISGRFDDPKIGIWAAVRTTLHHAFVRALRPGVENKL